MILGLVLFTFAIGAPLLLLKWPSPFSLVARPTFDIARAEQAKRIIQKIVDESEHLRPGTVTVSGVEAFPSGHRRVSGLIDTPTERVTWTLLLRERVPGHYEPAQAQIDHPLSKGRKMQHDENSE